MGDIYDSVFGQEHKKGVIDCNLAHKNSTHERKFIERIKEYVISLPSEGVDIMGRESPDACVLANVREDLEKIFMEFGF